MHSGVHATTWYAISVDEIFIRWFGPKWRYLKVRWDETSYILHLERVPFWNIGVALTPLALTLFALNLLPVSRYRGLVDAPYVIFVNTRHKD